MKIRDYYDTVNSQTEGLYKEKGSKFISFATSVNSDKDVDIFLDLIKTKHPKARHICYAYSIGIARDLFRLNDDGEPSGTAAKPIYGELLSRKLDNTIVAVVRYFGGTKLGATGLIRAYKASAADCLQKASIKRIYKTQKVVINYPLSKMGIIYDILKTHKIDILESFYEPNVRLIISIRKSLLDINLKKILASYHGYEVSDIKEDFVSTDITFKMLES